jgi:DNA-binding MarR family transcriptional regulator
MSIKQNTEKCYCITFRKAARAVTAYYDRMLLSSGVTITQYSLLINLFRTGPCSVTALAKTMKLERTTLIRNIKPLIEAGLIQDLSEERERDRRLTVTKAGLTTLEAAQKLWEKAQTGLKKHIGEKELENLMNTIADLEHLARG